MPVVYTAGVGCASSSGWTISVLNKSAAVYNRSRLLMFSIIHPKFYLS